MLLSKFSCLFFIMGIFVRIRITSLRGIHSISFFKFYLLGILFKCHILLLLFRSLSRSIHRSFDGYSNSQKYHFLWTHWLNVYFIMTSRCVSIFPFLLRICCYLSLMWFLNEILGKVHLALDSMHFMSKLSILCIK